MSTSSSSVLRLGAGRSARVTVSHRRATVERLFDSNGKALWHFALRMAGDPERARDLVQDTFLRALERRLPSNEKAAVAWLYRTLTNRSHDLYRRRVRRRADPPAAQEAVAVAAPASPEDQALERERLGRAIARLKPRRRAILLLHELDGHSVEGIATTFRLRTSTVRWHLSEAKRELREQRAALDQDKEGSA